MSLPNWVKPSRRRAFSAAGHAAKSRLRIARGVDAATLRSRALDDARGSLLRHGCTYSAGGEQHWQIIRSLRGRTDQRDVRINGHLWRTCGPRRLPTRLR